MADIGGRIDELLGAALDAEVEERRAVRTALDQAVAVLGELAERVGRVESAVHEAAHTAPPPEVPAALEQLLRDQFSALAAALTDVGERLTRVEDVLATRIDAAEAALGSRLATEIARLPAALNDQTRAIESVIRALLADAVRDVLRGSAAPLSSAGTHNSV